MTTRAVNRRAFLRGTAAAATAVAAPSLISVERAAAQSMPVVNMQLGWLASNGLLGEVVAQGKGFFADEGVELKVTPGGPNVDGVGSVAAGRAMVGQLSSSPSMMLARSAGIPVRAFAAGYQKHPFTYYSLKSDPIRKPEDMIGKTIATQPTAKILLRALLAANDIPEDRVEVVNMGSDMNQLMTGQAQAVTGWLTNTNALSILGEDRVDLMLWDTGIRLYANVYYASDATLAREPETLAAFLRGAARGWGYARANPEEAVDMLVAAYPNLDRDSEMEAVDLVLGFSFDKTTDRLGWGAMEADKWAAQLRTYDELGQFTNGTPELDEIHTMDILDMTADARMQAA